MQEKIVLDSIEEAIEEIRKGNFIIVVDDEDRENEGDLIIAAECITPEKVNFLETYARGLICAPVTKERAEELDLHMMVTNNTSVHATPFTVSIDLLTHGCTTGISAYDTAQTILALTRTETPPEEVYCAVRVIQRQLLILRVLLDYILLVLLLRSKMKMAQWPDCLSLSKWQRNSI